MKKVGIITYHFAVNYGAMLQCFALKAAVEDMGERCEVLNYISDKQYDNNALYRKHGIKNKIKNLVLLPFHRARSERQKRVELFRRDYLSAGDRLKSVEELERYVENNHLDILISGSDQVWNPHILDFNEAFFFPFKTEAKKIGYAVSIGKAIESDLIPYKKWICDFNKITVREESSCPLINKIVQSEVRSIADPVFLLSREDWLSVIPVVPQREPYLIAYFVKTQELDRKVQIAKKTADEFGLKLVIVSPRITKYNITNTVISNAGPLEFLGYMNQADYVCTDSFHGTVFSAILNKQFSTLERFEDKQDGRKTDILKKLGLFDRVQYVSKPVKVKSAIDYSTINGSITEIRLDAKQYLQTMLNG